MNKKIVSIIILKKRYLCEILKNHDFNINILYISKKYREIENYLKKIEN